MTQKLYGILVMILLGFAVAIASAMIFINSITMGIVYLSINFLAAIALIYFFCTKCSRKKECPHILPGKAALLFNGKVKPYTKTEMTIVVISFLLIVGIPQYWLRLYLIPLITFWLLIITTLIIIPVHLCPECENTFCPFKK